MVLTTTVITLYGPIPTFTVFSTFPRHTPPEVDFRRAVLEPLGLALLGVLLGIACFYLLFKKLQLRIRQQLKAQRTAIDIAVLYDPTSGDQPTVLSRGSHEFWKASSMELGSGLSLDNRNRYMQVHAENMRNVFKTSASIPYPQSTLNANTEGLSNHNSALFAPHPHVIIATPRSASPALIRAALAPSVLQEASEVSASDFNFGFGEMPRPGESVAS